MANIESLFANIVRFSFIACVLLSACMWLMQHLRQPLERARLIEITLLTTALTLVWGLFNAAPSIDLPLLPASGSIPLNSRDSNADTLLRPEAPAKSLERSLAVDQPANDTNRSLAAPQDAAAPEKELPKSEFAAANGLHLLTVLKYTFTTAFLVISALNLLYLAFGCLLTRRLLNRCTPLAGPAQGRIEKILRQFSKQPNASVVCSKSIDVPMVVGFIRPTILLPERLAKEGADPLELEHSLAHEWGHIQLHDLLTWQLVSLCQVFLWIQPLYWVLRRELRIAQDQLADQFAVEQTNEHTAYAATLVGLSRARQRLLPGTLTMAGRKSNLYRRIEMMMNENFKMSRATRKSILFASLLLFMATGGVMSSLRLTRAATPQYVPTSGISETGNDNAGPAKSETNTEAAEHSGVVLDVDTGKPIAGAIVTVTRLESRNWEELGVTKSVTDENGKYTFEIPPEQLKQPFLYISFDVDHPTYARRHGGSYSYEMMIDNLKNGEQPWFSQFRLIRGEKLTGRLVDASKKPISSVHICSVCDADLKEVFDRQSYTDGKTDANGRFEIIVPYEGGLKLSLVPLDHCMKYIEVGAKRGDIGDIVLESGLTIQGIVKDAAGKPMSDLWVNATPEKDNKDASYEMKRSAKTDKDGKFVIQAVKAEPHVFEVATQAMGALEKERYANFRETPPPAVFVTKTININEDAPKQPIVLQAVPHVSIIVQHFTSNGEISTGHSPQVFGKFDGKFYWNATGKRISKGKFELLVPHGIEEAELRFITNEHTALKVQLDGGEPTPQNSFRFKKLEEHMDNIRVISYSAGILKLDIVDESGQSIKDASIFAHYDIADSPTEEMMMNTQIGWNKEEALFRLSSIVPEYPVSVTFRASGFLTQKQKITLHEGERRTVKVVMKPGNDEPASKTK